MGVLGWTPNTVMREATVDDLADAYLGYAIAHGLKITDTLVPTRQFMQKMLRKFPDKETTDDDNNH